MNEPVTLETLREELHTLKALVLGVADRLGPASQSRPLTAAELMERWQVPGRTQADRLHNLAEKCRARGLRRMAGTKGMSATYMVADVIAAENLAAGRMKRRRRAA